MKRFLFILFVVLSGLVTQSHWPVRGLQQIKKTDFNSDFFFDDDRDQVGSYPEIEDTIIPFLDGNINFKSNLKLVKEHLSSFWEIDRSSIFKRLLLFLRIDLPPPLL